QGSRGEGGWLMVEEVKAAKVYGGLEVETVLDPRAQPFLYDHQMDGTPILPGVMGTEAFAEVAAALAPGYRLAAVENEQFHLPFKFYRQQPDILYLNVWAEPTADGELVAHTTLRSLRLPAKPGLPVQEKLHFTADVRLTRAGVEPTSTGEASGEKAILAPESGRPLASPLPAAEAMPITAEEIYRIYFHGPAYQVLERVQVEGERAIGLMAADLPPDTAPAEANLLMAPRLIELCFQTAGIWQIKTKGVMALPMALQSVTTYRQLEEADGRRLYAVVQAINGGASFDAQVVDETGAIYVTLTGYRTIALEGSVTL
ncbi:MAG: polyketide synthase dehydratase domain-containing protein, partial [Chloroflexota bacterium]